MKLLYDFQRDQVIAIQMTEPVLFFDIHMASLRSNSLNKMDGFRYTVRSSKRNSHNRGVEIGKHDKNEVRRSTDFYMAFLATDTSIPGLSMRPARHGEVRRARMSNRGPGKGRFDEGYRVFSSVGSSHETRQNKWLSNSDY